MDVNFVRRDGESFPARLYTALLELGGDPPVTHLLVSIRDMTDRKRQELELARAVARPSTP